MGAWLVSGSLADGLSRQQDYRNRTSRHIACDPTGCSGGIERSCASHRCSPTHATLGMGKLQRQSWQVGSTPASHRWSVSRATGVEMGPGQIRATEIPGHYGRALSRLLGETLQAYKQSSIRQSVTRRESCSNRKATNIYHLLSTRQGTMSHFIICISKSTLKYRQETHKEKKEPPKINREET